MASQKAKRVQNEILTRCTGQMLVTANIVGLGLCTTGCIMRFYYMFDPSYVMPADTGGVIFFLSTLFFMFFIALLGLSLLKPSNKLGIWVRSNFHFLDYYLGRGIFLLFIGLFLLELPNGLEVTLFVLVCCVAIVDLVVGKQELNARNEAE